MTVPLVKDWSIDMWFKFSQIGYSPFKSFSIFEQDSFSCTAGSTTPN